MGTEPGGNLFSFQGRSGRMCAWEQKGVAKKAKLALEQGNRGLACVETSEHGEVVSTLYGVEYSTRLSV